MATDQCGHDLISQDERQPGVRTPEQACFTLPLLQFGGFAVQDVGGERLPISALSMSLEDSMSRMSAHAAAVAARSSSASSLQESKISSRMVIRVRNTTGLRANAAWRRVPPAPGR